MKLFNTFYALAAIIFLMRSDIAMSASATHISKPTTDVVTNDLLGCWVGMFVPGKKVAEIVTGESYAWDFENKINISIDKIDGGNVTGHSVVAGNYRPFSGIITKEKTIYKFVVKEPGDDKYDGVFQFYIDEADRKLTGTWKANNKIRIPVRRYTLEKKIFIYNAAIRLDHNDRFVDWIKKRKTAPGERGYGDYDISYFTTTGEVYKYNASAQQLTTDQVANLKKADLFVLRNSIYARHGYSFKNQQLRAYFDRQEWYIPISTDIRKDLTAIEKKNIELLMRYENNAKEYYDAFGRG